MRQFSCVAVSLIALSLATGPAGAVTKPAAKSKAAAAKPAVKQVVTGPVAAYWMDTATHSGMTLSGMGAKPSLGSMMNMMKGGDNVSHSLRLRLSSTHAAPAEATGTHQPPAALNGGKTLPLYWKPVKTEATPVEPDESGAPRDYEAPKGKILIFWGCGEHAPKSQPVVLDLSKMTDPKARTDMLKKMTPAGQITLDAVRGPSPSASKAYAEWPNAKNTKGFDGDDSLAGAHVVKASFSPDIAFDLSAAQDFLPPIDIRSNAKSASGSVPLSWAPMARSKGFVATAVGGGQDVVVMWTSAEVQTAWMGFSPEYLTASDIDRLQAQKALLPGTATGCTVPAEVVNAAQGLIYGVTAYGGDTVMSWPPRPENLSTPWNIEWQTKVRYRSVTGGLLGQSLGMGASEADNGKTAPDGKKKKKSGMFGELVKQGLGGGLIP